MDADDPVLKALADVARLLHDGDDRGAHEAIGAIRFTPPEKIVRPSLSPALLTQMFRRDYFTCRYCGKPTVPPSGTSLHFRPLS
jgi:hypothetical protein